LQEVHALLHVDKNHPHDDQDKGPVNRYPDAKRPAKMQRIFHKVIFYLYDLPVWNLHEIIMSLLCRLLDAGFIRLISTKFFVKGFFPYMPGLFPGNHHNLLSACSSCNGHPQQRLNDQFKDI
jgi:hypothetical protein